MAEQLQAALADLWHTAGFLGYVAAQRETDVLQPADAELCERAARCQAAVAAAVRELEAALGSAMGAMP